MRNYCEQRFEQQKRKIIRPSHGIFGGNLPRVAKITKVSLFWIDFMDFIKDTFLFWDNKNVILMLLTFTFRCVLFFRRKKGLSQVLDHNQDSVSSHKNLWTCEWNHVWDYVLIYSKCYIISHILRKNILNIKFLYFNILN